MAQILKNVQLVSALAPEVQRPKAAESEPAQTRQAITAGVTKTPLAPAPSALQQQELNEAKKAASKEGFQIGYDEGLSAAQAKLAGTATRLEKVLAELNEKTQQPVGDQESALLEIAITAIARLTGETLADRQQALNIVRHALTEYGDQQITTVYLSSEDYDYWIESGLQFERYSHVKVVASPKVSTGGCLIETTNGFVDARVETQIERIRSILQHAQLGVQTGEPSRAP